MIARLYFRIALALFPALASPSASVWAQAADPTATPATAPAAKLTPAEEDAQRMSDLVVANHILASQGILDAWGHVSVRSAQNPKHFFMSRSVAPGLVKPEDIMEYDENSQPVDQHGRAIYLERFIHGEAYRARPDVQAVVHSHSPGVIPFSMTGIPLRMSYLLGAFLGDGAPVFEIRGVAGDTSNMQITDRVRGAALMKALGNAAIVLMRGHGDTVVGPTVKVAVARAIYADVDARIEMDVLRVGGKPKFFTAGEIDTLEKMEVEERSVIRPWELWKAQAEREMKAQ